MIITQNITKLTRKNSDKLLTLRSMALATFFLNKIKKFKGAKKVFYGKEEALTCTKILDRQLRNLRSELSHIFNTEYHESIKVGNKTYHHAFTIELQDEYLYLLNTRFFKKTIPKP